MSPRPAPPPELAGRWLPKIFTGHLAGERAVTPKTISSYRDAMKLLLTWFRDAEGIPPHKLRLADIDLFDGAQDSYGGVGLAAPGMPMRL